MEEQIDETVTIDYLNTTSSFPEDLFDLCDYIVIILSIIIIVVNISVVFSIGILLQKGQEPRSTYKFLGNISLADLILGISRLFLTLYPHQLYNEFICSLSICFASTTTLASIFTIGLIAIDRYLYIMYGLHYHRYITTKRSNYMILLTWAVSFVFGCLPAFVWRSPMHENYCWLIVLVPPKIGLILPSLGVIPLIIILVLYSIILKNALSSRSRIQNCSTVCSLGNHDGDSRMFRGAQVPITSNSVDDNLSSRVRSFGLPCCRISTLEITPLFCKNKWKAVKIVIFTTGAYFIIWFTYFVIFAFYAFSQKNCEKLSKIVAKPMSLVSLINSLINPVVYAWFHPGFRKSARKMYSMLNVKVCRQKSKNSYQEPKINQTYSI